MKCIVLVFLLISCTNNTEEMRLFQTSLSNQDSTPTDVNSKEYINNRIDTSLSKFIDTPINVNDMSGVTDSDKIDEAISYATSNPYTTIEFTTNTGTGNDEWWIDRAIEIPEKTKLLINGQRIKQNDGAFDNIIREANVVLDPVDVGEKAISIPQVNEIHIQGINGAVLEGSDNPLYGYGDWWGWRQDGVLFANCDTYSIQGVTMRRTNSWAIVHQFQSKYGRVKDIVFDQAHKNGDGCHFPKSVSRIVYENVTGTTTDDVIAIVGIFVNIYLPGSLYIYPFYIEGGENYIDGTLFDDGSGFNDVHHIYADNFNLTSTYRPIKILSTGNCPIYGIYINNVTASNSQYVSRLYTEDIAHYDATESVVGTLRNCYLDNIKEIGAIAPFDLESPFTDSTINDTDGGAESRVKNGQVNVTLTNIANGIIYY